MQCGCLLVKEEVARIERELKERDRMVMELFCLKRELVCYLRVKIYYNRTSRTKP